MSVKFKRSHGPHERLNYHITGATERGEAQPIIAIDFVAAGNGYTLVTYEGRFNVFKEGELITRERAGVYKEAAILSLKGLWREGNKLFRKSQ